MYSPVSGRFIARDPIDIADDTNLYAYVGNNPVMYVDLMGTEKMFVRKHDATALLKEYMLQSRNQLSIDGKFPKWGLSHFIYANKSMSTNKWNIKYNKEFQDISYDPNNDNQSCAGYGNKGAGWCKVYVNGENIELSEIGNFLIGYNGAYAGFTLNAKNMGDDLESNKLFIPYSGKAGEMNDLSRITTDIYEAGMRVEFGNYYSENKKYNTILNNALQDELEDREWYDNGYKTATKEIRSKWGF